MIDIIKTKITNKSEKTFLYRLSFGTYTLIPGASITIDGDLFTKETKQEGVTESILVSAYNGDLDITVIVDDRFVTNVAKEEVTKLPTRSQVRLINKIETKPEPVKVNTTPVTKTAEITKDVKVAENVKETQIEDKGNKKEEKLDTTLETKVEEVKPVSVEVTKVVKKEEAPLEQTELTESKKAKKAKI